MTKKKEAALSELKTDKTIVIKPVDKGGEGVILKKKDYDKEMSRLLDDSNPLPMDPMMRYKKEMILDKARSKGIIN